MNREELMEKLEEIEWYDFEVKTARNNIPKSAWETVSAFSNTAGGWLVFGVTERGGSYGISGVDNPEKMVLDFTTTLRNRSKFNRIIQVEAQ